MLARTSSSPVRASAVVVFRFVAAVAACSGVLLLADAALTLAWQEPVSAFLAARQQDALGRELVALRPAEAQDRLSVRAIVDPARRLRRLGALEVHRARTGHAIGRILLPTLHRSYVVVQGTDVDTLRKGPGHYPGTPFPGQGGTVAIAGHRTTYLAPFRTIDKLRPSDPIVLEMPYGRFTYRMERVQVVPPTALWITRAVPGAERLVLSACYPLFSAAKRIVAFARLAAESPS